jgi:SAM-dependent methyltransferase
MTTTTTEITFDEAKAEAFAGRVVGIMNDACLALMTSIGHRTGLFDTMASLPPATSGEIADAAGLQERYVREWLGAMATGRIVDHDAEAGTFGLPPEHAAFLTRAAGPDNLAVPMQLIALLASVEDRVAECFSAGGGVPYAAYTEFHRLMAENTAAIHDVALVDRIVPLIPGLPERLAAGIDVADIGCGSGHSVNLMAQAYPASRFTGYDFSEEGIAAGRAEAQRMGLTNAVFDLRDVTHLDVEDGYDLVTAFDAIHDQAKPADVLANIARALRPDGVFLMVDIRASSSLEDNLDHMLAPFLYTVSTMHCMTVSLALDGDGLGTMWGRQLATRMLHDAGFTSIEVTSVEGDVFNDYYVARRG